MSTGEVVSFSELHCTGDTHPAVKTLMTYPWPRSCPPAPVCRAKQSMTIPHLEGHELHRQRHAEKEPDQILTAETSRKREMKSSTVLSDLHADAAQ